MYISSYSHSFPPSAEEYTDLFCMSIWHWGVLSSHTKAVVPSLRGSGTHRCLNSIPPWTVICLLYFKIHLTIPALFCVDSSWRPSLHIYTTCLPPCPCQIWGVLAQLCYVHCQTSLGLTSAHSDPVPTPRGTIHIPFIHLSNLSDLSSLPIMGNCILSCLTPFSALPVWCTYFNLYPITFLLRHSAGTHSPWVLLCRPARAPQAPGCLVCSWSWTL